MLRQPCCTVRKHATRIRRCRRFNYYVGRSVRWTCVFRVESCQAANHRTLVPGLIICSRLPSCRNIDVNEGNDNNEFDKVPWASPLQCSSPCVCCQYGLLRSPSARSASWPMCSFNCPYSENLMSHHWSFTGCHSSAARFHMAWIRSNSSLPAAKSTETCLRLSCWARKPQYAWEQKATSSS